MSFRLASVLKTPARNQADDHGESATHGRVKKGHTMKRLSIADRKSKTRRQIALVDTALTQEFATLEPGVVHREVAAVSGVLLEKARFTDHVAVLTGRLAHENLEAILAPVGHDSLRSAEDTRHITKSHWWTRH